MNDEDEVIKALREEYEKKIEEQYQKDMQEKEEALKQQEEKHIRQMRALLSGRKENKDNESVKDSDDKTYEEELTDTLKKRFKL